MLYSPVEGDFLRICGKWVAFSFGSWYNQCEWKRSLTAGQIGICRGYIIAPPTKPCRQYLLKIKFLCVFLLTIR